MSQTKRQLLKGLFLLLCLAPVFSFSQNGFGVEASSHAGFMWAHSAAIRHLSTSYQYGGEVTVFRQPSDSSDWGKNFGYPFHGAQLSWYNLNDSRLGQAFSLCGYFDFPLVKTRKFHFVFRSATGIGAVTNRYDPDDNFQNIAIGSVLNVAIQYGFLGRWRLSPTLSGFSGMSITHFSNGAHRLPNLGINIPALKAGVTWQPKGPVYWETKGQKDKGFSKENHLEIFALAGAKGVEIGTPDMMPVYTIRAVFSRRITHKSSFSAGPDIFYSTLLRDGLRADSDPENPGREALRGGIALGYQLHINNFSYHVGMGAYVYAPYSGDGILYHRYGMQYRVKRLTLMLGLKSHFANADNIEAGIGYRF